jgi:hypothetical protein
VNNVNEAPTNITLSLNSVYEDAVIGTTIGTFSTTDEDTSNIYTYTLNNNTSTFEIIGNTLKTKALLNYESISSYNLTVNSNDGLNNISGSFIITVNDVSEDAYLLDDELGREYSSDFSGNTTLASEVGLSVPLANISSTYIILDAYKLTMIYGVATKGKGIEDRWVTNYTVEYSSDKINWYDVNGGNTFSANDDQNTLVRNLFSTPVEGRYIKVSPTSWNNRPGFRVGMYVSKLHKQWAQIWGTNNSIDNGRTVAFDSNNNVYVAGETSGDFGDKDNGTSGVNAFLTKLNSNGVIQWSKIVGSTGNDYIRAIGIDSNNNIYACGFTNGNLHGNTLVGNSDAFLMKFNSAGTRQWTKTVSSDNGDDAYGIAIDSNNNVYITGYTTGILDGTNAGIWDAFLRKYDSDGAILWTKQLGTTKDDRAFGASTDSSNNVYVTGYTGYNLAGTSKGGHDAFLRKYDSAGAILWTKQLGSTLQDQAKGVSTDSNNNVYITGFTKGNLDGETIGNGIDAFLTKYNSAGTLLWKKQLGTSAVDSALDVSIDSNNNVYITGYTTSNLDGTNAGGYDAFVTKYDSDGTKQLTKQFGTTTTEEANGIAIDTNNNVYITGYTQGDLYGVTNPGSASIFLIKFA